MKKLLLTSAGFENPRIGERFLKLIDKPISETKVLFIPTAARTEEELFYVKKSKEELIDIGMLEENIINFNLDRSLNNEELKSIDVIYVCGGNTFYLLHKLKESRFDIHVRDLINKGAVYVGASAGSIILGPDIKFTASPDKNNINLQDTKGLNLVNVAISPHYCKEEEKMIEEWKEKADCKILPLTDNQALLVIGDKSKIVE